MQIWKALVAAHREMVVNTPHTRPPAHLRREYWHLAQTRLLRFLCAIFRHLPPSSPEQTGRRASYVPPCRIRPQVHSCVDVNCTNKFTHALGDTHTTLTP